MKQRPTTPKKKTLSSTKPRISEIRQDEESINELNKLHKKYTSLKLKLDKFLLKNPHLIEMWNILNK